MYLHKVLHTMGDETMYFSKVLTIEEGPCPCIEDFSWHWLVPLLSPDQRLSRLNRRRMCPHRRSSLSRHLYRRSNRLRLGYRQLKRNSIQSQNRHLIQCLHRRYANGVIGGAHVGYLYQINQWVLGI